MPSQPLTCGNIPHVTDRLVDTAEAARAIGVDASTLRRWARAGYVRPAQRTIGGHQRWNLADLRRQVAEITDQSKD